MSGRGQRGKPSATGRGARKRQRSNDTAEEPEAGEEEEEEEDAIISSEEEEGESWLDSRKRIKPSDGDDEARDVIMGRCGYELPANTGNDRLVEWCEKRLPHLLRPRYPPPRAPVDSAFSGLEKISHIVKELVLSYDSTHHCEWKWILWLIRSVHPSREGERDPPTGS